MAADAFSRLAERAHSAEGAREALAVLSARLLATLEDPTLDLGPKVLEAHRLAVAMAHGGADTITVERQQQVTGMSRRTVQRWRAQLVDLGRLRVIETPGKPRRFRPGPVRPLRPKDWRRSAEVSPAAHAERQGARLAREADRAHRNPRAPQTRYAPETTCAPPAAEVSTAGARQRPRRAPWGAAAYLRARARGKAAQRARSARTANAHAAHQQRTAAAVAAAAGGVTHDAPPYVDALAREEAPSGGGEHPPPTGATAPPPREDWRSPSGRDRQPAGIPPAGDALALDWAPPELAAAITAAVAEQQLRRGWPTPGGSRSTRIRRVGDLVVQVDTETGEVIDPTEDA